MKKYLLFGLTIVVSAFLLVPLAANAIPVKYLGTDSVAVRDAGIFNAWAGTYRITLGGVEMSVMCDDVTATISSGQEWDAVVWGWDDLSLNIGKFDSAKYN